MNAFTNPPLRAYQPPYANQPLMSWNKCNHTS